MNKINKIKAGYKETKIGLIPGDWQFDKLEKNVELFSGQHIDSIEYNENKTGVPYLTGPTDFIFGKVQVSKWTENPKIICQKDDILITCKGSGTGSIIVADNSYCISRQLMAIRVKNISNIYLYYFLEMKRKHFEKLATGLIPGIGRDDIIDCYVPLPPLPEQKKIAEILSTWDRAIEKTEKLIDAKTKLKKSLMYKLLTGQKRFNELGSGFDNNNNRYQSHEKRIPEGWKYLKASELFYNKSEKRNGDEVVLSVTQDQGVVRRDSLDRRIMMNHANTGTYKLVEPGAFIISLRSFQGGLEYSALRGLVSPAYHVIYPKLSIDDCFYKYYFKSYNFVGHLAVAVIGIRDGKQINFDDFEFMKLPYPPVKEQQRIASVLSTIDKEISTLNKKLNALKQQKKGLMQKLLTGEVRVKV